MRRLQLAAHNLTGREHRTHDGSVVASQSRMHHKVEVFEDVCLRGRLAWACSRVLRGGAAEPMILHDDPMRIHEQSPCVECERLDHAQLEAMDVTASARSLAGRGGP